MALQHSTLTAIDSHRSLDITSVMRTTLFLFVFDNTFMTIRCSRLFKVGILARIERAAQMLWADEGQKDDISINAAHKYAYDLSIIVSLGLTLGCEREPLADGRFDGGTS